MSMLVERQAGIPIVDPSTFEQPTFHSRAKGFEDRIMELSFRITALMKDLQRLSEEQNRDMHRNSFDEHSRTYNTKKKIACDFGSILAPALKIIAPLIPKVGPAIGGICDVSEKGFNVGSSICRDHDLRYRETHKLDSETGKADSERASNKQNTLDQEQHEILEALRRMHEQENKTKEAMT